MHLTADFANEPLTIDAHVVRPPEAYHQARLVVIKIKRLLRERQHGLHPREPPQRLVGAAQKAAGHFQRCADRRIDVEHQVTRRFRLRLSREVEPGEPVETFRKPPTQLRRPGLHLGAHFARAAACTIG